MVDEIHSNGSETESFHKVTLQLQTISPLLLFGADQKRPELRAASIRGELRFWFRALQRAGPRILPKLPGLKANFSDQLARVATHSACVGGGACQAHTEKGKARAA